MTVFVDKIVIRYAPPENLVRAKFIAAISTNTSYSFWFAIWFWSVTETAGFVLLGINFALNMSLCYKVVRLHKKVSTFDYARKLRQSMRGEALTELILNEVVEILVPIAFVGSFATLYYGPNKDLTCCRYDILHYLIPAVKLAMLDSGSLIVSAVSLWWFCRINIFREYCKTIKRYWIYLALWGGVCTSGVSS